VGGVGPGPDSPGLGEGRAGSGGENVLQPALGPGGQVGQPPSPGTSEMRIRNKIPTIKVFYCCQSSLGSLGAEATNGKATKGSKFLI
jgi:hypothetical protein